MKRLKTKKGIALLLTLVVVGASAFGAYAYFTASGSGTGTASVGNPTNISLVGAITGSLSPAGAPAAVSVAATNNGTGAQLVGPVSLASINACSVAWDYTVPAAPTCSGNAAFVSDIPSCDTTVGTAVALHDPAFSMADTAAVGTLAASGGTATVTSSLQMNDTGTSQNSCKGAFLNLNFTSS